MRLRGWLLLLLSGVLGYVLTFLLVPKVLPVARWQHKVDHSSAVAVANDMANALGVESAAWDATVSAEYGRRREYYLALEPSGIGQSLITPVYANVKLVDPATGNKVEVAINSNGRPVDFEVKTLAKKGDENEKLPTTPGAGADPSLGKGVEQVTDVDRQMAESAAKLIAGEDVFAASQLTDLRVTDQGSRFTWKAEDQHMKLLIRVLVYEAKVKQVSLDPEYTAKFESAFNARRSTATRVMANIESVVIWPAVILVVIIYFIGLALKRIQHKQGLIFLAVVFLLVTAVNWLEGVSIQVSEGFDASGRYWLVKLLGTIFFLLGMLFAAGSLYFVWAAGQSLAIRARNRRTISLELILKGKLLTNSVARSFIVGWVAGGVLISIPILLALSGFFAGMELDPDGLEDYLVSVIPAFSPCLNGLQYLAFVIFGFVAPLASLYVKRPLAVLFLVWTTAILGMMGAGFVYLSAPGLITTAVLMATVLTVVYFRGDLLAVIVSLGCAKAALVAATLLVQPLSSLQNSGWRAITGGILMAVVSLIGVRKFRGVGEEETAIPPHLLESRDERERLKAEFNVARRAQQQMLPDEPPRVPGLEIAAVCQPSKDVGGDLYDFLPLSNGCLGVVVADVSGKGVPASLYMTLTKGLLASVSETISDPGDILREVNRHLYDVCKRRMFVTLFLGVIDPITKKLVYARAGHNPTVFRRPGLKQTSLLKSAGMGLGLNGGKIFDQTLKVEALQLEPNDKLFFYSDGITEAMNSGNEEYGEERLMAVAARLDELGAAEARDAVIDDVKRFLESNLPQDDQTLIVVKVV